jgi:hypothetical protein
VRARAPRSHNLFGRHHRLCTKIGGRRFDPDIGPGLQSAKTEMTRSRIFGTLVPSRKKRYRDKRLCLRGIEQLQDVIRVSQTMMDCG